MTTLLPSLVEGETEAELGRSNLLRQVLPASSVTRARLRLRRARRTHVDAIRRCRIDDRMKAAVSLRGVDLPLRPRHAVVVRCKGRNTAEARSFSHAARRCRRRTGSGRDRCSRGSDGSMAAPDALVKGASSLRDEDAVVVLVRLVGGLDAHDGPSGRIASPTRARSPPPPAKSPAAAAVPGHGNPGKGARRRGCPGGDHVGRVLDPLKPIARSQTHARSDAIVPRRGASEGDADVNRLLVRADRRSPAFDAEIGHSRGRLAGQGGREAQKPAKTRTTPRIAPSITNGRGSPCLWRARIEANGQPVNDRQDLRSLPLFPRRIPRIASARSSTPSAP